MTENFAEMFEQSINQMNMRVGEIITGEVVDINRDVVIVNAGLKSEGVIPVEQFYDENGELDVNIGDTVEAALDSFEDGYGKSRLSRRIQNEINQAGDRPTEGIPNIAAAI